VDQRGGAVSSLERFTRAAPCPVCGGDESEIRGKRLRCFGFLSSDGKYAHCTREELAGSLPQEPNSDTYSHRLEGSCRCGSTHGGKGGNGKATTATRQPRGDIAETYDYTDADGKLLFQVVRLVPKDFRQRRPDGNGGWAWHLAAACPDWCPRRHAPLKVDVPRVLYRLPNLLAAPPDMTAFIVEGEKDVHALERIGLVATTNPGGAGKWKPQYGKWLRGHPVVLIADNDAKGRSHAKDVEQKLSGVARDVHMLELPGLPEGGDVSDWLDARDATEPKDLKALLLATVAKSPRDTALVITWDEFVAEQYPPVPSLWGDALLVKGGGYLIVGGDTGVGKTILVSNLIFALVAGMDEFLGFPLPGRPVSVLFLEAEGSRQKFRDRLQQIAERLGVRRVGLPLFFHRADADLSIKTLGDMLEQSRVELAFLDPVGRFYSGNENLTDEWRGMVTNPLAKLATWHSTAFVLSDHYSKPNEARSGQHKIRGSAAKVQDCGAALRLEIGRAGGRSRILFFDRVRDGAIPFPEMDPSRMALEINVEAGTVEVDARDEAESALAYREARVADVVEVVRAGGTEIKTRDLIAGLDERTGLEKSRAKDLIVTAKAARVIERARHGYYRLPGELLGRSAE
jgi:hypothetical protein